MTLSRRKAIKVIGAGVIVAAAGAAIAVPRLDAMPATAVEGWSGPPSGERDPRRRALAFALLAPSPHNLQSWLVDLAAGTARCCFSSTAGVCCRRPIRCRARS